MLRLRKKRLVFSSLLSGLIISLWLVYIESVMKFLKWSSLIIKDPVHQTIKVVQPPPSASTSTVTVLPRNFQVVSAKTGNHPQQQLANVRSRSHIGPTGSVIKQSTKYFEYWHKSPQSVIVVSFKNLFLQQFWLFGWYFLIFLVSAFLEQIVDYSHGFSSVFFSRYTWSDQNSSTPKVIQNFEKTPNCTRWPKELNQKVFSTLRDFFSGIFFPKGSHLQFFWSFVTEWMLKNPKGSPF